MTEPTALGAAVLAGLAAGRALQIELFDPSGHDVEDPFGGTTAEYRSVTLALERMARDVRMFTIGGGTAEVLRNVVAGAILKKKLPQTRDGWSKTAE